MPNFRAKDFRRGLTRAGQIVIIVIIIIIVGAGSYFAGTALSGHPTTTAAPATTVTVGGGGPSTSTVTSTSTATGSAAKVTIAMTVSQVGQYASLDAGYLYLNEAWQQYVNAHGGLVDANGVHHQVVVITTDDQSDVSTAVSEYHQFAEDEGANIMVSPYSADTGLELLPIAQSDHVPLIMSEASTKSMWTGQYTWAVTPLVPYWSNDTTNAWSASYFSLLNQSHWAHTIAFVGWNIAWAVDDYTSGIWLAQHTTGLTITSQQLLTPNFNNPDFSTAISQVLTSNGGKAPDIVFCAMFGPFCAQFITQAESQGLIPKQWHTIEWGSAFAGILASKSVPTQNITTDVFWTPNFPTNNTGTSMFNQITQTASTWAVGNQSAPVTWYNYQNIEIRWEIFQMINASIAQIPTANFSSSTVLDASINSALHHLSIQTISGPLAIQPAGYGTMGLVTVQFENDSISTVWPQNVANMTYVEG